MFENCVFLHHHFDFYSIKGEYFDTLEQKSLISTFDQNGDIRISEEEF